MTLKVTREKNKVIIECRNEDEASNVAKGVLKSFGNKRMQKLFDLLEKKRKEKEHVKNG